jgi:hypothetical protein
VHSDRAVYLLREGGDVPLFMDYHDDLKLPAEARDHHAALGVPCGDVHPVNSLL